MRRHFVIPILVLMLASCKPADPAPVEETVVQAKTEAIKGFVWLDLNGDGISSQDEPRIADVSVDLVFPDSTENTINAEIVPTNEKGEYQIVWGVGDDFSVRFSLPKKYAENPFTQRDIGAENTDSDVNPAGETAFFTLTEDFSMVLSAGILPVEPYTEISEAKAEIEDALNDCVAEGQEEKQACEGDIHHCQVVYESDDGQSIFSCALGQVTDYSQFDFYVTLNLDGDPSTGRSEGQAQGVDAELYLNTQETRIQINHYDPSGNYIRADVLDPEVAIPVLGTANEGEIGITITQWVDDLRQLFKQNPQASFVLVTYTPTGGLFIDNTAVLPDSIRLPGIE